MERAVLEQVRRRDPDALGALFEYYFDLVYGLAYRLVGEQAGAEDVTQDVFLKIHRAAERLDPTRDPGPWLVAITLNSCRDLWRSGGHRLARRSVAIEDATQSSGGRGEFYDPGDPEQRLLAAERERLVQEAIMRLPEPLRVAVILRDYQGMSHEEIAAVAGVSYAAIRKRYSRALAALGEMLRESLE